VESQIAKFLVLDVVVMTSNQHVDKDELINVVSILLPVKDDTGLNSGVSYANTTADIVGPIDVP